jgi:hypothetical protein
MENVQFVLHLLLEPLVSLQSIMITKLGWYEACYVEAAMWVSATSVMILSVFSVQLTT